MYKLFFKFDSCAECNTFHENNVGTKKYKHFITDNIGVYVRVKKNKLSINIEITY